MTAHDFATVDLGVLALVGYFVGSLLACVYALGVHEGKGSAHHDR